MTIKSIDKDGKEHEFCDVCGDCITCGPCYCELDFYEEDEDDSEGIFD